MKKVFPFLCAVTIITAPFGVHAQTDEVNPAIESNLSTAEISKPEWINEFTLEDVIRRGTENSKTLTVLQLNVEISKNELLKTVNDKNKVAMDIKKLEDKIVELQFQEEEVKENLRIMLTSSYTNLLLLNVQKDFTKKTLQSAINNVNKHQLLYNLGKVSKEKLHQAQTARDNVEKQLKKEEKKYQQSLADLFFDIGIIYQPNMEIKDIEFEPKSFEMPADNSSLIIASTKMKRAQNNLELAIINRNDVYQKYENGEATIYEKENQDYFVNIAEQTIISTRDELKTSIEQLYRSGENSYSSYEEAVSKLESKRKEVEMLKIRYRLGKMSKYDYEQAQLGLQEAELNVYQAKVQNYMIQQSIESLQKGYVQ